MANPAIVHPEGEIDMATADAFRSALARAVDADPANVTVDLSDVTFIDSTGLGAIMDAERRCRRKGGRLLVVAPHGSAAAVVIELTGLGPALQVVGSR